MHITHTWHEACVGTSLSKDAPRGPRGFVPACVNTRIAALAGRESRIRAAASASALPPLDLYMCSSSLDPEENIRILHGPSSLHVSFSNAHLCIGGLFRPYSCCRSRRANAYTSQSHEGICKPLGRNSQSEEALSPLAHHVVVARRPWPCRARRQILPQAQKVRVLLMHPTTRSAATTMLLRSFPSVSGALQIVTAPQPRLGPRLSVSKKHKGVKWQLRHEGALLLRIRLSGER